MKNQQSPFASTKASPHAVSSTLTYRIYALMPSSKLHLSLMMAFLFLLCGVERSWGQALYDSYTDGDFTASPVWGGSTTEWTIVANSDAAAGATGSNTLRLNAPPVAQIDYLSSQVAIWGDAQEWAFFVGRRAQAFTAANQMYIWLYANESTLTNATVDGYRIAIGSDGGGGDAIRLEYMLNGAVNSTVLTSAGALTNGLTDIGFLLRITRSTAGLWTVYSSVLPVANGTGSIATAIPNAINTPVNQGSATHNAIVPAANGYLGVAALHTTSVEATAAVEFDQLYFSASSATDYFRTISSGNWNSPSTWESSPVSDFSSGIVNPATLTPNENSSGITIRNAHNVSVSSAVTADQIVVDAGGTLTQSATLTLANGAGDDLTVDGTWEWSNGTISNPGNVVISSSGTANLSSANPKYLGANLTNNGTINWQDGVINYFNTPTLTNNGLWTITSNSPTSYGDSYGTIINQGTITKTSAGITDFSFVTTFNNLTGATINFNGGELRAGSTTFNNEGALAFSSGTFKLNSGVTFNYKTGSTVSGTGTFNNNALLNLMISVDFPSTMNVINTATITGVGDLTINSDFTIQGVISGPGILVIHANTTWIGGFLNRHFTVETTRTCTISSVNDKYLQKNLTNDGTLDWQAGLIAFYSSPTIINNSVWTITGNNNTTTGDSYGTINNSGTGTITKTSVGNTDFLYVTSFSNSGTMNFNGGNLRVGGGPATTFTNTGALAFNGGSFTNQTGTTFNFNPSSTISATAAGTFTNSGVLNLSISADFPALINVVSTNTINGAGDLTVNSDFTIQGSINGPGILIINANSTWPSGVLNRALTVGSLRTLTIPTAGFKSLYKNLTNNGTINWQDGTISFYFSPTITNNGLWTITGNNVTSNGDSYGTIINSGTGTITKTSVGNTDFLYVTSFSNSGTMNFNGGNLRIGGGPATVFTHTGALAFNGGTLVNQNGNTFNYNSGSPIIATAPSAFTNNGILSLSLSAVFPALINVVSSSTINGAGDLTINSDFIIQGQILGSGILTINANSTWTGGVLGRVFTVDNTRTLTINTATDKYLSASLTNNGTINWQAGLIAFSNSPTITNNALWNITGNNSTTQFLTPGTINNTTSGIITKTSSGTSSFTYVTTFINSGTLNFNGGTTAVGGAGSTTFTNTGALAFSSGAFTIQNGTTFNYNSGSTVSGSGTLTNGATMNLNTNAVFPAGMNVVNNGTFTGVGNLTLNSDFVIQSQFYGPGILTINANSFWIYGTLGRQFTVDATRTLTINTSNDKYLQANLTNNGTIVWQHGNIIFDGFRTITNNNIWSITGDRSLSSINSSFGTINNVGTITKTSTGTTSLGWVTLLTNSGTINCNAGILSFGGAGATTFTNIGTLSFAGGTFNGSAGVTFNHNANAIIKGTGTFIHNTTFNRNGIISPGASPGILAMNGTEPFSANTTINIEVLDNSGPGTGHDPVSYTHLDVYKRQVVYSTGL